MASAIEIMLGTAPSSIIRASSTLTRAVYLRQIKYLLDHNPEAVLDELKEINTALRQASNFRILIIANVERLERPVSSWTRLLEGLSTDEPLKPLDARLSRLSKEGKTPGGIAFITPLHTTDTSFALAVGKGPSSWQDPQISALMVTTAYLNAVEGPLWTATRGPGLAYGAAFLQHTDSGQVSLKIWSSPDASKAFAASKEVVLNIVSGQVPFDRLILEGAVSSIVLSFANADATMATAAQSSFVRQVMRSLPKDYPNIVLEKVRQVTMEEIKTIMKDIFMPIFDADTSNLVVVCAPIMEERQLAGLGELGYKVDVKPLAYFQDDYGLKVGEESDGEDDDDMDDEDDEDGDEMESNDDDMSEDD